MECGDKGGCNRIFSNTSAVEAIYQSMSASSSAQRVRLWLQVMDDVALDRTWGTHFAGTNEPASMCVTPVFANRLTSSIFVCNGIDFFSFCKPSRGPTSTMRAWSAECGLDVLKLLNS